MQLLGNISRETLGLINSHRDILFSYRLFRVRMKDRAEIEGKSQIGGVWTKFHCSLSSDVFSLSFYHPNSTRFFETISFCSNSILFNLKDIIKKPFVVFFLWSVKLFHSDLFFWSYSLIINFLFFFINFFFHEIKWRFKRVVSWSVDYVWMKSFLSILCSIV